MPNPPEEPEMVEIGKDYPVLVCQNPDCRRTDRILEIPTDEEGQPKKEFLVQCGHCKTNQTVRLSDIQRGRARQKH